MLESTLIPDIPEDIMAEYIVPKVMDPILVVMPNPSQYIDFDASLRDFMVLLCVYKYMGVNKALGLVPSFWHGRSAQPNLIGSFGIGLS